MFIIWFFGLPGSGKTTLASITLQEVKRKYPCVHIDGDSLREYLPNVGFDETARNLNVSYVRSFCKISADNDVPVVVSMITPYRDMRIQNKRILGERLFHIWCKCSMETLLSRDPKGLYRKALLGEIESLTGVQDRFDPPQKDEVDLIVDTEKPVRDSIKTIMEFLQDKLSVQSR